MIAMKSDRLEKINILGDTKKSQNLARQLYPVNENNRYRTIGAGDSG
jgi:hypothetical protein